MKKTALLIYDSFCSFEISVALEALALAGKPITVFSHSRDAVRSEEGLTVLPDKAISDLRIEEYDSLLLPGAADIRTAVTDESIRGFIMQFDRKRLVIGAISIAPVLLLKCGILKGKPFMAGVNKAELLEEGFTPQEMSGMIEWDDCVRTRTGDEYVIADNIITSVSFHFVPWALAFGKMIGVDIPAETFGRWK